MRATLSTTEDDEKRGSHQSSSLRSVVADRRELIAGRFFRAAFERVERAGRGRVRLRLSRGLRVLCARFELLLYEFENAFGRLVAEGAALGFEYEFGHLDGAVAEARVARDEVGDDASLALGARGVGVESGGDGVLDGHALVLQHDVERARLGLRLFAHASKVQQRVLEAEVSAQRNQIG